MRLIDLTPERFQLSLAAWGILYYFYLGQPGKILYWLGVVVLTLGLTLMKG